MTDVGWAIIFGEERMLIRVAERRCQWREEKICPFPSIANHNGSVTVFSSQEICVEISGG